MNEVLRQLYDRKSMRVYEDRPISDEDKAAILKAAVNAPTAGNQQMYTILDITDQALKEKLAETCDHQPFIATGKMVLVFCADYQKWYDGFASAGCQPRHPGSGDLMLAVTDTVIAAQNAVVAAESLGIGSCYIGDIMENCELHRQILGLPEYVFPAAMLVFGYPTQQQKHRQKPQRADMRHIIHENAYRRMDAAELKALFSPNAREGKYEDWMRAFCNRKYNSDFSREMSRSVDVYLEAFREKGDWEKCVAFHGHSCGGLSVGYRAAKYAMELLDIVFSDNEQVVCIAENDACGLDAIQVLLGCSVGKGNLLFHMTGKQAFSFYNRKTGKSVRLVAKPKPEGMTQAERFEYYHSAPNEALFEAKPATIKLPEQAKLFDSYTCDCCGETAGAHWIRLAGDRKLCLDCYESYDRFDV
ncbi:MAG: nitroreductase family protein [Oscillospiraceae bacterium]|nr:nitroreductase family protein [Oscillospiraceae bacterium]